MKRFILASIVAAFASVSAVQAGEDCDKAKAACADKAKVVSACCTKEAKAKVVAKKAPEKGATLLVMR